MATTTTATITLDGVPHSIRGTSVFVENPSTITITASTAANEERFTLTFLENIQTVDRRLIEANAISFDRDPPLPLMLQTINAEGHKGAALAGTIDTVERDGAQILAHGRFDMGSDAGREAHRLVTEGVLNTWSPDLGDVDFQVDLSEDGEPVLQRILAAVLIGGTLVPFPALSDAKASVEEPEAIAAAAAPVLPPATWFDNPRFGAPGKDARLVRQRDGQWGCPFTANEDGSVFGHLALWGTCHTGFLGQCLRPRRSETDYVWFRVGALRASGPVGPVELAVGRITLATGHASLRAGAAAALAHYDDTGTAVADVICGEDQHGIWVAGGLRPDVTDEQLRVLRASPLSGDWRPIGGRLEMIAAHCVNSPGYPITRVASVGEPLEPIMFPGPLAHFDDAGELTALVAAGAVEPEPVGEWLLATSDDFAERLAGIESRLEQLLGLFAASAGDSLRAKMVERIRGGS